MKSKQMFINLLLKVKGSLTVFKGILYLLILMLPNSCQVSTSIETTITDCNTEQFEQYGNLVYEHLKYNFANTSPEYLLPEEYRVHFKQNFDSLYSLYGGWEYIDILNHFESENALDHELRITLEGINEILQGFGTTSTDLQSLQDAIHLFTDSKLNDPNISCFDKGNIKIIESVFNGLIVYLSETGWLQTMNQLQVNQVDSRGCIAESIGCFFALVGTAAVLGVLGSIIGFTVGLPGVGAVVGVIIGVTLVLNSNACTCQEDFTCFPVMGVSLIFSDCTPAATYTAFGFGNNASSLIWANTNGTPATANTPAAIPRLLITQSVSTVPVTTIITTNCNEVATPAMVTPAFTLDLSLLAKSVYAVSLFGPTITPVNSQGDEFTYYVAGVSGSSLQRYEVINWTVENGTIVSIHSNNEIAEVVWDENESLGQLYVKVRNKCPDGETKTLRMTVHIGAGPRQEGHE